MHYTTNNIFKVTDGKVTASDGSVIENPAVMFELIAGVRYCGEYQQLRERVELEIKAYTAAGATLPFPNLTVINFSKRDKSITIDDVCTLMNYFMNVSANAERQFLLLFKSDAKSLKTEIVKLRKLGF